MTTNEKWTLAIAIYGAVVATMVFGWDVLKWLATGPRLKVSVTAGMVEVEGHSVRPGRRVVCIVVNRGDMATTITHLAGYRYSKPWHRHVPWIRREEFFIKGPLGSQPLPYVLQPGQQWMGLANQTDAMLDQIRTGALFLGVEHSHSDTGIYKRVRAPKPWSDDSDGTT